MSHLWCVALTATLPSGYTTCVWCAAGRADVQVSCGWQLIVVALICWIPQQQHNVACCSYLGGCVTRVSWLAQLVSCEGSHLTSL